ncbi:MAG: T9SS type A sorting domain-containing protein [Flavobacterium sp.]|nr:T9SS type A sorting domain-containing protein [Flavobacterium sp.]
MKNLILLISITLIFTNNYSQVFVKDNTFIYAKNVVLFDKGNLELSGANSNLYLRNEAQFIQGTLTTSTNKGIGKLSVFQEGSVNSYSYNYWCSPIGNASASIGNEPFGITMLNQPTTVTASSPANTTHNFTYNGVANPLQIEPYWIWKFQTSLTYAQWSQVSAASTLADGQGFTMKGTNGTDATNPGESVANNTGSKQRYDFRGKPNDGDITINVSNGNLTLTGNPYPSAIDLSLFLTNSLNCTGVAYFWEQDKTVNSHNLVDYRGGYGTYSPVSRGGTGIYVPAKFYNYTISGTQLSLISSPNNSYARFFSPIGQGFMIEGNASGSAVTMKNLYRVYQKENGLTSVFEKNNSSNSSVTNQYLPEILSVSGFDYTTVSTTEVPQIKFNTLMNNLAVKQIVVGFDPSATDGVDHAKDAKNPTDSAPLDMYFVLDSKEYIISVIDFDENKRLPIGFKANAEVPFKITVAGIINFSQAENVYLFDKVTGIYHDIKNNEFEFSVPAGVTNDRYEITFKDSALTTFTNSISSISIVQNNTNQLLKISNPNLAEIKTVNLYDISGKLIFSKTKLDTKANYEFSTSSLSDGIYIVKLISNDNQNIGEKISIANRK